VSSRFSGRDTSDRDFGDYIGRRPHSFSALET
jgi:hypothetical protein